MKIRAAILSDVGAPFDIRELDLQPPQAGEVLVRVAAVGVCHSDWHLVTGDTKHPMPLVPGHEGAGYIEAIGEGVAGLEVGDLVALNWAPNCGHCFYCLAERPSLCDTYVGPIWAGTMLDGTTRLSMDGQPVYHYSALACFAERCVVPAPCCVKMPEDLSPEIAAVIGCAVTTGVGSVLNTARVRPGSSVAVIGAGGIGLSTIMGARFTGADPIFAIDPLEIRREAAKSLGADKALHPNEAQAAILEATGGRGADYVFEAVGKPELQEWAVELARPGGTVVFSGLSAVGSATNIPGATLVRQEKTVMGSYYGTANTSRDFPLYAHLFQTHRLPLDRLVSNRYSLDQLNEAYDDMLNGRSVRGGVVF